MGKHYVTHQRIDISVQYTLKLTYKLLQFPIIFRGLLRTPINKGREGGVKPGGRDGREGKRRGWEGRLGTEEKALLREVRDHRHEETKNESSDYSGESLLHCLKGIDAL
jgi:hypothetical protein